MHVAYAVEASQHNTRSPGGCCVGRQESVGQSQRIGKEEAASPRHQNDAKNVTPPDFQVFLKNTMNFDIFGLSAAIFRVNGALLVILR